MSLGHTRFRLCILLPIPVALAVYISYAAIIHVFSVPSVLLPLHILRPTSPNHTNAATKFEAVLEYDPHAYDCHPNETRPGVITVQRSGRLGNMMCQYATLWAVAKKFSLKAGVLPYMSDVLFDLFPGLSLTETRVCPDELTSVIIEDFLQDPDQFVMEVEENGVILDGFPQEISFFHQYRSEIRTQFEFRSDLSARAQSILHDLNHNGPYVGIHIRRTDYEEYIGRRNKGRLVDLNYFRKAMDLMRQMHPEPVFVVTSDDEEWSKKHVVKPYDTHWVGDSPEQDMATLSACNHSIISQGTFGFWTAYLAGGTVILPDNFTELPYSLYEQVRRANISDWIFMDSSF